ncbi:MAG: hypothetical protein K2W85_08755 [Phycisphaerales bacterium]|nr:hypothetical protein [Phycisphaerales bacterium]
MTSSIGARAVSTPKGLEVDVCWGMASDATLLVLDVAPCDKYGVVYQGAMSLDGNSIQLSDFSAAMAISRGNGCVTVTFDTAPTWPSTFEAFKFTARLVGKISIVLQTATSDAAGRGPPSTPRTSVELSPADVSTTVFQGITLQHSKAGFNVEMVPKLKAFSAPLRSTAFIESSTDASVQLVVRNETR